MESVPDVDAERLALFAWVQQFDCDNADVDELGSFVGATGSLISYMFARQAVGTRRHEQRLMERAVYGDDSGDDPDAGEGADPGDDQSQPSRPVVPPQPPESAKERARRLLLAKWLKRCPLFAEALEAGRISAGLVETFANILERLEPAVMADLLVDETGLLLVAQTCTPEQFAYWVRRQIDRIRGDHGMKTLERQQRDSRAWVKDPDQETGMYLLGLAVDPLRGTVLFNAISQRMHQLVNDGKAEGMSEGQLRLQAIIDLICGEATVVPEALVITDHQTATSGPHDHSICETVEGAPLPAAMAVNCRATATITAAIVDSDGRALALGCAQPLANRRQRRALRAMYRTCAYPGCSVSFPRCQIHHVTPREVQGPTDLDNLLPLCFEHHHLVHEGGWRLTIDLKRTLRWYRPDGTLQHTTPLVPLVVRPARPQSPDDGAPPSDAVDGPPPGRAPPTAEHDAASSVSDDAAQPTLDLFDNSPAA